MCFPFVLLNVLNNCLFFKSPAVFNFNDAKVFIAIIDCNSELTCLNPPINHFEGLLCLNLLLLEELVMFTFFLILLIRCVYFYVTSLSLSNLIKI